MIQIIIFKLFLSENKKHTSITNLMTLISEYIAQNSSKLAISTI